MQSSMPCTFSIHYFRSFERYAFINASYTCHVIPNGTEILLRSSAICLHNEKTRFYHCWQKQNGKKIVPLANVSVQHSMHFIILLKLIIYDIFLFAKFILRMKYTAHTIIWPFLHPLCSITTNNALGCLQQNEIRIKPEQNYIPEMPIDTVKKCWNI